MANTEQYLKRQQLEGHWANGLTKLLCYRSFLWLSMAHFLECYLAAVIWLLCVSCTD